MNTIRVGSLCFVVALVFAPLPAQAQTIQARVARLEALVATLRSSVATLQSRVTTLRSNVTTLQSRVTTLQSGQAALEAADIALQNNINAEAGARAAADTTLQTNINNEATARAAADTTQQGQVAKLEGNITAADLVGTYSIAGVITDLDGGFPAKVELVTLSGTLTLEANLTGSVQQVGTSIDLIQGMPWSSAVVPFPAEEIAISWTYANGILNIDDGTPNLNINFNVGAGGRVLTFGGLSDDDTVDLLIATRLQ